MSVVIISNKYPFPPRDGSSIAILSSLRMWHRLGHKVHLFSLNPKKSEVPPDALPNDLSGSVHTHTFAIDTDVTPLGAAKNLLGNRPYHISRFYREDIAQALEVLTAKYNFDFVQWEGPFMGEYMPHVNGSPKHLMRSHNIEHRIWLRLAKNTKNPLLKYYLRLQAQRLKQFELSFSEKMDGILPITDVDATYFAKTLPTVPLCVILPGVDVDAYPLWKETNNKAVSLASFDWEPNREGMMWFIKHVIPLLPNHIKGHIGGRNMPAQWKSTETWTINRNVDNAHAFLINGNVQFIPLHSGSGIRIKIVEAMCMGMPVVATAIAAEGSGLRAGTHYLEGNTPVTFAKALDRCINDVELRHELSKAARKFALDNYDLSAIAKTFGAFVKSL